MRDRGSHNPSGSIADISAKRARGVVKLCPTCGAGLMEARKTYCAPCYDVRLQANIAANRSKYIKR